MTTVDTRPSSVNDASITHTATHPAPEDAHLDARNKALEASAVVTALTDALIAFPKGTIPEHLQALAVICDRICKESVAASDLSLAASAPSA